MIEVVEIIKLFSNETRARILFLIWNKELCNCDIENVLKISQSNISKHLRQAEFLNFVEKRKDSYWTYYKINPQMCEKYKFIEEIFNELSKIEPFKSDFEKLEEYLKTPGRCKTEVKNEEKNEIL
ncbi:ArsR/SmtB family transcription factor [Thermosipho atlanticus]|uniref:ArsR family transcriptional regulator n=1 Tax=Thermosipho atlanticus DSM 15807 TaxID=1123380 RepID=A0A1M5TNW7_9BACT|nr:metalloregulator ArsR/SmtB family transcription factor [Thermosipho atlanticus]SHH52505.1 ArsR family transcriptional regulator [Thermosipho atlanticus DSM 15807]